MAAHFQINRETAYGTAACFLLGQFLGGLLQQPLHYEVRGGWTGHFCTQRKLQLLAVDSEGLPTMWGMNYSVWKNVSSNF